MKRLVIILFCQMSNSKNVLIIGGTRFSGLYLWKELHDRVSISKHSIPSQFIIEIILDIKQGHSITLFNRGKSALKKLPKESDDEFNKRTKSAKYITGNRQVASVSRMYIYRL